MCVNSFKYNYDINIYMGAFYFEMAKEETTLWFSLIHLSVSSLEQLLRMSYIMFSQNAKALKAKKEEGNKAFKEGNFEAAYELYSEALTIDPNNIKTNAKLYCNRATVGSKVSNVQWLH